MELILGGILLVSALILVCLVLLLLNLRSILLGISDFTTPAKEGEVSPLQGHLDRLASGLADRVFARTTGVQGGVAKRQKALEGALALDAVQMVAPPWLKMLLELAPNFKKKIEKNPMMAAQAMQMFAGQPKPNGESEPVEEFKGDMVV